MQVLAAAHAWRESLKAAALRAGEQVQFALLVQKVAFLLLRKLSGHRGLNSSF